MVMQFSTSLGTEIRKILLDNAKAVADKHGICLNLEGCDTFIEEEDEIREAFTTYGYAEEGEEIVNRIINAEIGVS